MKFIRQGETSVLSSKILAKIRYREQIWIGAKDEISKKCDISFGRI